METIVFRAARGDDLPELHRLYSSLQSPAGFCSLEELGQAYARASAQSGFTLWIAEESGAKVGSYILVLFEALGARCRPVAVMEDVVVAPQGRRQGVGRRMVEHAIEQARAAGAYKLMLSSNLSRPEAHAFYESLGFERHGYSFVATIG